MKLVVAVSGGVDSVVLLHKLFVAAEHELVVAHFDHGIRPESDSDADFVRGLADMYGLEFELRREDLGVTASEDLARARRYDFLWSVAKKHGATLATAHHSDDLAETIAINLVRGTGWRGLAPFSGQIFRPLLDETKRDILDYALKNKLEWVEDETNVSDDYLRNRLRKKINDPKLVRQLADLFARQRDISAQIEAELDEISPEQLDSRYFFTMLPCEAGIEVLRRLTGRRLTRPQLERALLAIKTQKPGTIYEAGSGVRLRFLTRNFTVEVVR